MKALSLFLPFVVPHVASCSDPMAEQAVLSACIEFCERSLAVQNTSAEDAAVGQADYDVEEPSQQRIVKVLAVGYRSTLLRSRAAEMVVHPFALRGEAVAGESIDNGTPVEWFARDPGLPVVSIYPPPDEAVAGAVTIKAALAPTRTATSVADALFDDFAESIAAGAIARLLIMPGQPFAAPSAAPLFRSQFLQAATTAAIFARHGRAVAASRVVGGTFV